jgi:ribonuclease-3
MKLERIQQRIGYTFQQPDLLVQALTHRSHGSPHNERLEFLGDSVLNCVIAAELYGRFPRLKEGELSRMRASLVRQEPLHQLSQLMAMGDWLQLGEGELKSGGFTRPSILADALEALIGAVFLDGGFGQSRDFILRLYRELLDQIDPKAPGKDPKTQLQEFLQSRRIALPKYAVTATHGAAHNQNFEVECVIPELAVCVTGTGSSRRNAEQAAAQLAYEQLRKQ